MHEESKGRKELCEGRTMAYAGSTEDSCRQREGHGPGEGWWERGGVSIEASWSGPGLRLEGLCLLGSLTLAGWRGSWPGS